MTSPASGTGRLLVVGTPIGNLADLSPRAAAALRDADLVVAEDTRVAKKLLAAIGTRTATLSFTEHNARSRIAPLLARLAAGETLALTTDAGMPGVSDPGATLVAAARGAGAAVEVVPGPSSVSAAFAGSGVDAPGFLFAGFLPARPASARSAALERVRAAAVAAGVPLVLFESTHRIRAALGELEAAAPDARVVVARELTKRHEEIVAGTPSQVAERLSDDRGEFVVIVDERDSRTDASAASGDAFDLDGLLDAARRQGLSSRTVLELLRGAGVARRDAYRLIGGHPRAE